MFGKPLYLNGDFKYCLDTLSGSNKSMIVTGRAGTGKSTLLRLLKRSTKKKMVVLAPTGIAALNVGGQTIHSFFGFPARLLKDSDIRRTRKHGLFKKIELMVIDEISMVRADLLDYIDRFLRLNRDKNEPFGGLQVFFFGDMFQLPPVLGNDMERKHLAELYATPYFFSSYVYEEMNFEKVELGKVYRQEGRHFLRLLEAIRLNRMDYEDLEDLNMRCFPHFEPQEYWITLCATNRLAERINGIELSKVPGILFQSIGMISGKFTDHHLPADKVLQLKVGAQVMFLKNDIEGQRYANGTIGRVTQCDDEGVKVLIQDDVGGTEVVVDRAEWEVLNYKLNDKGEIDTEVVGTFEQYPLRLAWAITIHKSQGKTFDRVVVDLGRGAFVSGQTYVALSRCKTMEGLVLRKKLKMSDIIVDDDVVNFYENGFL